VGQDLFPKDFIINIPSPSNYVGPGKIFGLPPLSLTEVEEEPLPLVRIVDDHQGDGSSTAEEIQRNLTRNEAAALKGPFVPDKHRKDDPLPDELPDSLKFAVKCFILSAAARRTRGQIDVHNTMLIHVSRFIRWQDRIAALVDNEFKFYQRQIEMR